MDSKTRIALIEKIIDSVFEFGKFEDKGFLQGTLMACETVAEFGDGEQNGKADQN